MTKYDLRPRSFAFSVKLVRFIRALSVEWSSRPLISQLLRSGTSIGANIEESDSSPSRKDFKHKLVIAKKEAAETVYWLKILIEADILSDLDNISKVKQILGEAEALVRILASIINKL